MPFEQSEKEQPTFCATATNSGPICPLCGGTMIPMRGVWRCARCYFTLCAGCEVMPNPVTADEE